MVLILVCAILMSSSSVAARKRKLYPEGLQISYTVYTSMLVVEGQKDQRVEQQVKNRGNPIIMGNLMELMGNLPIGNNVELCHTEMGPPMTFYHKADPTPGRLYSTHKSLTIIHSEHMNLPIENRVDEVSLKIARVSKAGFNSR